MQRSAAVTHTHTHTHTHGVSLDDYCMYELADAITTQLTESKVVCGRPLIRHTRPHTADRINCLTIVGGAPVGGLLVLSMKLAIKPRIDQWMYSSISISSSSGNGYHSRQAADGRSSQMTRIPGPGVTQLGVQQAICRSIRCNNSTDRLTVPHPTVGRHYAMLRSVRLSVHLFVCLTLFLAEK